MLGGPLERSGFPPPAGSFTPPRCGLFLLRRSQVGQIVKRSIAPRAVALVGVPSGSCCKRTRRSAALSNPPAARKSSRLPAVIAVSSRAISWRISGSALVGVSTSGAPWPSPSWVQCFSTGAAACPVGAQACDAGEPRPQQDEPDDERHLHRPTPAGWRGFCLACLQSPFLWSHPSRCPSPCPGLDRPREPCEQPVDHRSTTSGCTVTAQIGSA